MRCVRRHVRVIIRRNHTTSSSESPRINPVGIQYLSNQLQSKVFPKAVATKEDPNLLKISKSHLKDNDLLGKPTQINEPITIKNFPDLVGKSGTLDEHFYKLGVKLLQPYLSMADNFLTFDRKLPKKPKKWEFQSGWTRYEPGKKPEQVPYPLEDEIVFDVEVLYKISPYAVLNTAVTTKAWYGWVLPLLVEKSKNPNYNDYEHLIPFNCLKHPKLLIGYNVGYDRARVFDEYNIEQLKAFYLDGMALHVAITGICSRQRPEWLRFKKQEEGIKKDAEEEGEENEGDIIDLVQKLEDNPWLNQASPNSLKIVSKHHCNIDLDKADRDFFSSENPQDVIDNFQKLMNYCSVDVEATFKVTAKLFPEFREKIPHPVSFAALRHLGTLILPSTKKWDGYIETAESIYQKNRKFITELLNKIVDDLLETKSTTSHSEDDWLAQLDWEIKQPRLKKNGEPTKRQAYLTGYPQWYRDLYKASSGQAELSLSLRTRSTPFFLRLKWEGYPLFWTNSSGWCFKVKYNEDAINKLEKKNYIMYKASESDEGKDDAVLELLHSGYVLFKIPHPNGPSHRCTNVLGKNYLPYFKKGILSSEYEFAREILNLNSEASYWMGNRQRIKDQFIVYNDPEKTQFFASKDESSTHPEMGIILPKICSMGTVTRRAVENTWLTASNSKKNRIGSELKAMIEVPKGYAFVGADVDSEELWIASLMGDSVFKFHGATALGWMTLEGTKNAGTDLHSKTAEILGILRNDAKVFNYGRIYGAGIKFATRLLMQFNGELNENQAFEIAKELYVKTKGTAKNSKKLNGKLYFGGSESFMFNRLENIANSELPKTPVLGASITSALTKKNLNSQQFLPSRVNWTIQSSGVDYLHLLIISMEYLSEKYNIPVRLSITVHDELRYLCKEEYKYKVALLLQISNLWTRAMFCQQLGINEVPQSCAFFSEVDIDNVLRKEVGLDCVTPSHPDAIPPGESLDISGILNKCGDGDVLQESKNFNFDFSKIPYQERSKVLEELGGDSSPGKVNFESLLKLQSARTSKEFNLILRLYETTSQVVPSIKSPKFVPKPASKLSSKSIGKKNPEKSIELSKGVKGKNKNIMEIVDIELPEDDHFDESGKELDADFLLEQAIMQGNAIDLTARRRSVNGDNDIVPLSMPLRYRTGNNQIVANSPK